MRFGANVQPGQVVAISTEPGKEPLARAIAGHAYRAGAKFVDVVSFDPHIKLARAQFADPESLAWVPPWYGDRVLMLGELKAATIATSGPVEPRRLMDGIDPSARSAATMLPRVKESTVLLRDRSVNWTIGPGPTPRLGRARLPRSRRRGGAASACGASSPTSCRLKEPDPVAAWEVRFTGLLEVARRTQLRSALRRARATRDRGPT